MNCRWAEPTTNGVFGGPRPTFTPVSVKPRPWHCVPPRPHGRDVNERSGTDVLVPGVVYRIKIDADEAVNVVESATKLVEILEPLAPGLSAQSIVESATSIDGEYPVSSAP